MEQYIFLSLLLWLSSRLYTIESRIIPNPYEVHVPSPPLSTNFCYFGHKKFAHQEVVLALPEVCLRLICNQGVIETVFIGKPGQTHCCEFDGLIYTSGAELPLNCFKLICRRGHWFTDGKIQECCSHCFLYNDPHLKTFDKYRYDWHGRCNYTVTQTGFSHNPDFAIFSDFEVCNNKASCLGITTFKDNPNTVIVLDNGMTSNFMVNGELQSVTDLGVHQVVSATGSHPVLVWKAGKCLAFTGSSKLAMLHCPNRLDVWAHPSLIGSLNGLCGHYNSYQDDDFTTRNNVVEHLSKFPMSFPSSWMTGDQSDQSCHDPCPPCFKSETEDPCEADSELRQKYLERCRNVLHNAIGNAVELIPHIESCAFDICLMYQNGEEEDDVKDWLRQLVELLEISKLIVNGTISDPCFMKCTKILDPVCGTDGRTYSNKCLLEIAMCKNKCIQFSHKGRCSHECPIEICTLEYQPICGTDGVTYSNHCGLQAAKCDNPCLEKLHDGECEDCNKQCPEIFNPVCGSGMTYDNECYLNNAICENPCIEFSHYGNCLRSCPILHCTKELKPVCGTDGKTYDNKCLLEQAQCNNKCIKLKHVGQCSLIPSPRTSVNGSFNTHTQDNAKHAFNAENAENAMNAENAFNAMNAENAENAKNAENAENAINAVNAVNAVNAINILNEDAASMLFNASSSVPVNSKFDMNMTMNMTKLNAGETLPSNLSEATCDCIRKNRLSLKEIVNELDSIYWLMDNIFGKAELKAKSSSIPADGVTEAVEESIRESGQTTWVLWSQLRETLDVAAQVRNAIVDRSCNLYRLPELFKRLNEIRNEILLVRAEFDNQTASLELSSHIVEMMPYALEILKAVESGYKTTIDVQGHLC